MNTNGMHGENADMTDVTGRDGALLDDLTRHVLAGEEADDVDGEEGPRFNNLYSPAISRKFISAFVMTRYGFTPSIVCLHSHLHTKTVAKVRSYYYDFYERSRHGGSGTAAQPRTAAEKSRVPNCILHDPATRMAYNSLMALYIRFHQDDPSRVLDINALLLAWNVYHMMAESSGRAVPPLSITAFWNLAFYLNYSAVRNDNVDWGRMIYDSESRAFYYRSNFSARQSGRSPYPRMKSLSEISRRIAANGPSPEEAA